MMVACLHDFGQELVFFCMGVQETTQLFEAGCPGMRQASSSAKSVRRSCLWLHALDILKRKFRYSGGYLQALSKWLFHDLPTVGALAYVGTSVIAACSKSQLAPVILKPQLLAACVLTSGEAAARRFRARCHRACSYTYSQARVLLLARCALHWHLDKP